MSQLYDDITYETSYLSIKALEFFRNNIEEIKMVVCDDTEEVQFDFEKKTWTNIISVDMEENTMNYLERRVLLNAFYTNTIKRLMQSIETKYGGSNFNVKFEFEVSDQIESLKRAYAFLLVFDEIKHQVDIALGLLGGVTG
jgi:hypothetical protein